MKRDKDRKDRHIEENQYYCKLNIMQKFKFCKFESVGEKYERKRK